MKILERAKDIWSEYKWFIIVFAVIIVSNNFGFYWPAAMIVVVVSLVIAVTILVMFILALREIYITIKRRLEDWIRSIK